MTARTPMIPTWAARTVYTGAGGFGLLNLVVSSLSIADLAAMHLHLGAVRSTALALTPDMGALVAATMWVACTGKLRAWGRSVSLGLVAGSVVANAADVLAAAGLVGPTVLVPLAVALAVVAPIVSMLLGHLVLLVRAAVGEVVETSSTSPASGVEVKVVETVTPGEPVQIPTAVAAPPAALPDTVEVLPVVAVPTPSSPPTYAASLPPVDEVPLAEVAVEWAVVELAAGRTAGWKRLASQFPLTEHHAKRVAADARRRHLLSTSTLHVVGGAQ